MQTKLLEKYINLLGIEKGTCKYNCYVEKQRKAQTLEGFIEKYGNDEGLLRYNNKNSKIGNGLNSFIKRFGVEEGTVKYNEYREKLGNGLNSFIKRFGVEEGTVKYNSYCKKLSNANTKEGYIAKYGETLGLQKWDQMIYKQQNSKTLEGLVNKFGDIEGTKKRNALLDRMKSIKTKEYYIEKFGYVEGLLYFDKIKAAQDRMSLNYCIKKYGSVNGPVVSKQRMDLLKNNKIAYFSKSSQELFFILLDKIQHKEDVKFYKHNNELQLRLNKTLYFYDFVVNNKIIEFNGDYWHMNPSMYKADDISKGGILAKDVWNNDKNKINFANSKGFDVLVIWESEFKQNKELTIQKCLTFLNN